MVLMRQRPPPSNSPAVTPLTPNLHAMPLRGLDRRSAPFDQNAQVVGLEALPSSFSLCRPAGRRRWGSLVSASSTAASCKSDVDARSDEDNEQPPLRARTISVSSEDLEIVMSPSGSMRHANEVEYLLSLEYILYFDSGRISGSKSKKAKNKDEYEQQLKEAGRIASVQDYWCHFNNINLDCMPLQSDLSLFKKGYKPMWETPENENGGRFIISSFHKDKSKEYFEKLILAFIGLQFTFHENVNGIVYSVRHRGPSISLWYDEVDPNIFWSMDNYLKCLLEDEAIQVEFRDHRGAMNANDYKQRVMQAKAKGYVPSSDPREREWQEAHQDAVEKSKALDF